MQTVSNIDNIGKPPISTESTSAISCAALLMQYGPFVSMEYYDLQSRCRSYDGVETVISLNNKLSTAWSYYNAKSIGNNYSEECRLNDFGREYRGKKNTTAKGIPCMVWSSTYPHTAYSDCQLHLTTEEGSDIWNTNYCRNPDNTGGGPWCYTMDLSVTWGSCGIPFCHCYN